MPMDRTCIVTRRAAPKGQLLRFVCAPDHLIVADLRQKLPGKGVWITCSGNILKLALKRRLFSRYFEGCREPVPEFVGIVEHLLENDALQYLSLANKAGLVITGATKVSAALSSGMATALVQAHDGSRGERKKLSRTAAVPGQSASETAEQINLFESYQLDLALGRTNVIHAALLVGAASDIFLAKCSRLSCFRGEHEVPGAERLVRD